MTPADYMEVIERALVEDLGDAGDITTSSVVPARGWSQARLVTRVSGVVAGVDVARATFHRVDPDLGFDAGKVDGDRVAPGDEIATVIGGSQAILIAERTALNLMGRMSGVASATAELVEAVAGTGARITDTRKTMPGLRALDKYAVVAGGGVNHRFGLYDEVMIKDNHILAAAGIARAVTEAREALGDSIRITVEVEDLDQLEEALGTTADRVLLDNMTPDELRAAVEMVGGRVETEASGGVTLGTVRSIAEAGVDFISVGWITHSAPQLDIALDFY